MKATRVLTIMFLFLFAYAVRVEPARADNSLSRPDGTPNAVYVDNDGRVGIGTTTPGYGIDVETATVWTTAKFGRTVPIFMVNTPDPVIGFNLRCDGGGWRYGKGDVEHYGGIMGLDAEQGRLFLGVTQKKGATDSSATDAFSAGMCVTRDSRVGVGTDLPLGVIDIRGGASNNGADDPKAMAFQWAGGGGGYRHWIRTRHNAAPGWGNAFDFFVNDSNTADGSKGPGVGSLHVMTLEGGNVGIGTTNPSYKLDVHGTAATDVLVIRGGADVAEPFSVSQAEQMPKGSVVVIDEENPGRLKLSSRAYDGCVAGVVSGAGGLKPGLTLSQQGLVEGGVHVALTGRVYALADCSNGPIKPGDLLTTSSVPGHAMKATDRERSFGAVIGKAMSPLEEGQGLVLVLVGLQ
jgi:hypothetical protein